MDLLSLFVEQVVGGRLTGWSLSRLAQRRLRERAVLKNGVYVLRFGHGFRVIGAVITGFVIGMWLLFLVTGFRMVSGAEVSAVAFSIFGLLIGGGALLGGFGNQTRLTVNGIDHRRLFVIKTWMPWSEIVAISFSYAGHINIRSKSGQSMDIALAMKGSGTLAEQILERVPASILDTNPEAHARLVRIRQIIAETAPPPQRA